MGNSIVNNFQKKNKFNSIKLFLCDFNYKRTPNVQHRRVGIEELFEKGNFKC